MEDKCKVFFYVDPTDAKYILCTLCQDHPANLFGRYTKGISKAGHVQEYHYDVYQKLVQEQAAIIQAQAVQIAQLQAAQIKQKQEVVEPQQLVDGQQGENVGKGNIANKDNASHQLKRKSSHMVEDILGPESIDTKKVQISNDANNDEEEAEVGTSSSKEQQPKPRIGQKDEGVQQKKE